MTAELRISPRERLVLTAILEMYIANGEPVASQSIARLYADKEGMSSATIRNVMAALSDGGLLEQPHTSAGRIPTAKAFRFYVEHLAGAARAASGVHSASQLPLEKRQQIDDCFAGVTSRQHFLERTSHVLAMISSGVGSGDGRLGGEIGVPGAYPLLAVDYAARAGSGGDQRRHGAGPGACS